MRLPFIDISEIGAGGGSLITFDRGGHFARGTTERGIRSRARVLRTWRRSTDANRTRSSRLVT